MVTLIEQSMDYAIGRTMELKRPGTLHFSTKNLAKLQEQEVVASVKDVMDIETVAAIQVTFKECRITLKTPEAKYTLQASGINLRDMHIRLQDADRTILNVTVKDAPVEMQDIVIASTLEKYGTVVQGSIRRGTVKGTDIQNGTRYLHMINIQEDIPRYTSIGRFQIRIICDRNVKNERKCYRCYSTDHLVIDCPESSIVCGYCGQTGHKRRDCVEYRELELGEQPEHDSPAEAEAEEEEEEEEAEAEEEDVSLSQNKAEEDADIVMDSVLSPPQNEVEIEDPTEEATAQTTDTADSLLLGASIVKHLNLAPRCLVVAESGTTAGNVQKLLDKATGLVDPAKIENVMVHLGTNDAMKHKEDPETVKLNLTDCVAKIQWTFPGARVAIASVPPRKGRSANILKYNQMTDSVNTFLSRFTERREDLDYMNTVSSLRTNKGVIKRFYSDIDTSGVHLSRDGQNMLMAVFKKHLQAVDGPESRKRNHSETPNSAEKDPKKGREQQDTHSPGGGE